MNKSIVACAVAAIIAVAALPTPSHAHGRASVGVYFGGPVIWPHYGWGYSPYWGPRYYPPPVVTVPVPVSPPVYVEQSQSAATPQAPVNPEGYWYYCRQPAGYYPTVPDCPGGWQRVSPLPAQ